MTVSCFSYIILLVMDSDRSQELGIRWAEAYDCWINAPGSSGPIYTCPQAESFGNHRFGTDAWPLAVRTLRFPVIGLTASNPLGEEKALNENQAANQLLEKELGDLENACWWRSFGFGKDWQEHGFVVSCERSVAIELAKKYRQGAVYEFVFTPNDPVVLRKTVPVLIADVEADVPIVTCDKPSLPTSEPDYLEKIRG